MASPAPAPQPSATAPKRPGFWTRYFAAPNPATLTPAQRWYDNFSSVPMFVVSITWLVSTFFTWSPALSPTYRREGVTLSIITWGIFAVDLLIRFVLDPQKKNFVKRAWPIMLALIFPPLRILLVIAAVMRLARDRNALAKIVGLYAVYAVLFVVIFGALSTLMFEINAPGANILSFGDAVWWGFVTVTTVGYGDFTPVTVGGRAIAVIIMFTGAAAVGAVTAAVASRFINSGNAASTTASQEAQESQGKATDSKLDELIAHVKTVEQDIRNIADRLDGKSATRGTAGE